MMRFLGGIKLYISELILENFRGFKGVNKICFSEGTNVIIGHNNTGKTTVIKALELLFGDNKKRLTIDDFNKNCSIDSLKENPPKIKVTAKLIESDNDEEYSDDLVTVSTWLTKIDKPYEALITYDFFLPQREEDNYKKIVNAIDNEEIQDYWDEIEYYFLRKYTYKIFVGNPEHKNIVEPDLINKFDFQFLTAIRDVEKDLLTGQNKLLKEIIDFFIDYDLKTNKEMEDSDITEEIKKRKKDFLSDANPLIKSLQDRMEAGKQHMLRYAKETGASFDNLTPSFEGIISDTELYSALKLIVENDKFKLPAIQNGLGYNNLIYISLVLAKMQKDASGDYLGGNAKTFSILAIEEPEAHLHPNMQYKFLKFLNENQESEVRQVFVTSHSPNITAAADLNDIIILNKFDDEVNISYPGRVFDDDNPEDLKSKNYVQRFLDVTKADMFFAKSLILVEGISEQLLVPEFAKILNSDITDSHVSVINIGGKYFDHFLKLFDVSKSEYAIKKRIACITDLDPLKKKNGGRWTVCSPFILDSDPTNYEYQACSNKIVNKYPKNDDNDLIRAYAQEEYKGCTFEYDLILENSESTELITDLVTNGDEIKRMMNGLKEGKNLTSIFGLLRTGKFKTKIISEIEACDFEENEKIKHVIASRYLYSVNKGSVAQELAYLLSENHKRESEDTHFDFTIPQYISEAIKWICQA